MFAKKKKEKKNTEKPDCISSCSTGKYLCVFIQLHKSQFIEAIIEDAMHLISETRNLIGWLIHTITVTIRTNNEKLTLDQIISSLDQNITCGLMYGFEKLHLKFIHALAY